MIQRLCVMMFLQFFIWGAWFVSVGNFLALRTKTHPDWNIGGFVYSACPIAAMISPIFLGMIADRFFATQKVLGVMHVLGGIAMFFVAHAAVSTGSTNYFEWMLLVHALCFMPTLGLSNALAFHHIESQEKQFPLIRVFGTLGWIAAGLFVSLVLGVDAKGVTIEHSSWQFWAAGVVGILLGIYSFTMPNTPPPAAGKKVSFAESLGLGAVAMMKSPVFATFMIASFLTCIPLMAYYALAQVFVGVSGFESPAAVMTIGQVVEVVFMLVMPLMFLRFGVKWMLAMGMLAWVLRYGLFSVAAGESPEDATKWMIILGIALHGICYDFFFVTGQIYVDKVAPAKIRGQAQGFLVLMTLGLGSYVGSDVQHRLSNDWVRAPEAAKLLDEAEDIRKTEVVPIEEKYEGKEPEEIPAPDKAALAAANARIDALKTDAAKIRKPWKEIWLWPAAGALGILILFVLLFRYRDERESDAT